MPIVRSPCTLECPRTGHTPGAGLADHAAHQQHVGDLGDHRHGVAVLRQTHRPADDRALRCGQHLRDPVELGAVDTRRLQHGVEVDLPGACLVLGEVRAVRVDEVAVDDACPVPRSSASSSSRPSPANSAMSPPSRIWTNSSAIGMPWPTTPCTFCGSLNRISPASGSGLTAMILAPLAFAFSSTESMRGWLVPGFCPAMTIRSASVDVLDGDRTLADADRLGQRGAGGLVAHVRAVRQVVGAEAADHQLVEERGLVAGAPRGVEHRLVRGWPVRAVRRRSTGRRRPSRWAGSGRRRGAAPSGG